LYAFRRHVLVWELADGAFSYAAVPRFGLWPTTPP
jgi:hypothetical protein